MKEGANGVDSETAGNGVTATGIKFISDSPDTVASKNGHPPAYDPKVEGHVNYALEVIEVESAKGGDDIDSPHNLSSVDDAKGWCPVHFSAPRCVYM